MILLSRVAEDLYWMARYLERAQATARAIIEHTNLVVDLPYGRDSDFAPLLAMMGGVDDDEDNLSLRQRLANEETIVRFLTADEDNPSSVVCSLTRARENMRATRQLLPLAAWECLNPLTRRVAEAAVESTDRHARAALCTDVIRSSQQLLGIFETMMSRDDAYGFMALGRQLERADMTTRVLDVRATSLLASDSDTGLHADVRWLGVLRCLGAHQMYRRTVGSSVEGSAVLNFLLCDAAFPRAVARCVDEIELTLLRLPKNTVTINACRDIRIQLGSVINDHDADELHELLDQIQIGIAGLHDEFVRVCFSPADTTTISTESS